jgi:VanZ family protein
MRQAHVSDKTMHFAAYLALISLWWCTISPNKKVNWRKATVWWTLFVMVWYSVIDELLQTCVGRSADVNDFLANLAGTVAGLVLFSIFSFWFASIIITGIIIFISSNLSRVSLAYFFPSASAAFHLFAYAFLTMLWIEYLRRFLSVEAPGRRWLVRASALPVGFLLIVKFSSFITTRGPTAVDVICAFCGIVVVVATLQFTALRHRKQVG